jgi:hypothetical protein
MNGFIAKTVAGLSLAAGLSFAAGCMHYREIVDPCWPQRYNAMARSSVREATGAQAFNGHLLDQTVWDNFFVHDKDGKPSDILNDAGIAHLQYLSRRRPVPDLHINLQTAQDIPFIQGPAEKTIAARAELDQRRCVAVQNFLATQLVPRGITAPVEVAVFDAAPPGQNAIGVGGSLMSGRDLTTIGGVQKLWTNFQGVLTAQTTLGGGGGGSGGGGSSGGGGGSSGGGSSGGGGAGR